MSILHPISDIAGRAHRSTGPLPMNANDAVLRSVGVLTLLAIGAIHFLQIVQTTEQTPLLSTTMRSKLPSWWSWYSFSTAMYSCVPANASQRLRYSRLSWIAWAWASSRA